LIPISAESWIEVIALYKKAVEKKIGRPFPQEPKDQLWGAIGAVFASWMNDRAITYRRLNDIPESWGTAVNVQADGVRQYGRDLGHGRGVHARSVDRREAALWRVPGQRAGRGCGGGHPHAGSQSPTRARRI